MPGLVVGIGGHRRQSLAQAGVQTVEDPPVSHVRHPAGRFDLEPLAEFHVVVGEIAVRSRHDGAEQLGVVASGDDDPQCTSGYWRQIDCVYGPGQLSGEHALDILIAKSFSHRNGKVRGVTRGASGIGLVAQPGSQAGDETGGADPLGQDVGIEEVLLNELAESRGELVLAFHKQRRVRYRQAKRTAEQSGDREPVRNSSDHGRLCAGLHVAKQGPVDTDHGHGSENGRHPGEKSGCPPARGDQSARSQLGRLTLEPGHR